MSKWDEVTSKDMAIVDTYIKNGMDQKAAFITHGYGEQYAHKGAWAFFNKPKIKKLVEKRLKKMEEKVGISYQWCLEKLKGVVENGSNKECISAISEINKMCDHYSPQKHQISGKIDVELEAVVSVTNAIKKKYERNH